MNALERLVYGLALTLAMVSGLAGAATAQVEDFDAQREGARAALLTALEEQAEWCGSKKIFLTRQRTLDLLLLLEPEHEQALEWMGYKRDRDGGWTPPRRAKKLRDFNDKYIEEASARYEQARGDYLGALHALLEHPKLTRDQRLLLFEDILPIDPDDPVMRRERGEVRAGDAWVLLETARASEVRAGIDATLQAAGGDGHAVETPEPNPMEMRLGLGWSGVLQSPTVRVVGTVEMAELQAIEAALSATMTLYRGLLNESAKPPLGFTAFVLGDPEERLLFLQNYPNLPDEERTRMAQFSSAWIDRRNHTAVWMESKEERVDGLVRLLVSQLLARDFRIGQDNAWVHEGFGLYLTEAITGTRLTWYVQPEDTETEDGRSMRRILTSSADWRDDAAELFTGAQRPRLGALLDKPLAGYALTDLLHAYLLASFLFEGQPEGTAAHVARQIGIGKNPRQVLEEAMGRSLDEFDRRIPRWLQETGHGAGEG